MTTLPLTPVSQLPDDLRAQVAALEAAGRGEGRFRIEAVAELADGTFETLNPETPDIRFERGNAPVFYSALARAITTDMPRDKNGLVNADQAAKWLVAKAKEGRLFKQTEVEWSDVLDFLEGQSGKVAVADIATFVKTDGVQVLEVVKGKEERRDLTMRRSQENSLVFEVVDSQGNVIKSGLSQSAAASIIESYWDGAGDTKYGEYVLPGGENYREILLTLPVQQEEADGFYVVDDIGSNVGYYPDRTSAERHAGRIGGSVSNKRTVDNYRSSHWDEPNVLAHIRFNERVDAGGKRVLFVEELQSDWAKEGRTRGFASQKVKMTAEQEKAIRAHYARLCEEMPRIFEHEDSVEQMMLNMGTVGIREAFEAAAVSGNALALHPSTGAIPDAPFVTDTKAWVSVAVKRIIRYAAENGFEKIAFINGQQSVDRYDLSKRVKRIDYDDRSGNLVVTDLDGRKPLTKDDVTAEELPGIIGKEAAERLLNNPDESKGFRYSLAGNGLKVGGDGMVSFYDQIVPQVVNDVLKKLGGGKVGEVDISTRKRPLDQILREEFGTTWGTASPEMQDKAIELQASVQGRSSKTFRQPGFDITPELLANVMRGVPMFSRVLGEEQLNKPDLKRRLTEALFDGKAAKFITFIEGAKYLVGTDKKGRGVFIVPGTMDRAVYREIAEEAKQHGIVTGKRFIFVGLATYTSDADSISRLADFPAAQRVLEEEVLNSDVRLAIPGPVLRIDNPGGRWLEGKRAEVAEDGLNHFGTPAHFGSITGYFDRYVMLPVSLLKTFKGLRNEQRTVRQGDLQSLIQLGKETGRFPLLDPENEATTYNPFIQVDMNGTPWINEGNHRIMAADALKWDYIPVTLRYFTGGEQAAGPLTPERVLAYDRQARLAGCTPECYGGKKIDTSIRFQRVWKEEGLPQEETPAFLSWFGESKIVGPDGKPLMVYHGTASDFSEFDQRKIGSVFNSDKAGFFFSSEPKIASEYAEFAATGGRRSSADGANVMPVYVSLQNPMTLRDYQSETNISFKNEDAADADSLTRFFDEERDILLRVAKNLKKDGVLLEANGVKLVVAFRPGQIKSATGNNGDFGPDNADIRFQRVWHGTPHQFDRFSLDAVGSGEGNQTYGWGLYFAGKQEVAEHYKKQLSYYGSGFESTNLSGEVKAVLRQVIPSMASPLRLAADTEAKKIIKASIDAMRDGVYADMQEHRSQYDEDAPATMRAKYRTLTEALAAVDSLPKGQLYEVEIPEDEQFLLWDKPLAEQSEVVKAALRKCGIAPDESVWDNWTGEQMYMGEVKTGVVFDRLTMEQSKKQTSLALHETGIAGIKYLDGQSRSIGEGSYNYVVFDDRHAQIIKDAVKGIESHAFKAWFGASTVVDEHGMPRRMYHGTTTPDSITAFMPGGADGSRLSGDAYGVATYFTSDPHEASSYARDEGAVLPVYIRGELLDVDAPLSHEQSLRLTSFANEVMLPSDKARFEMGRETREFTNDDDAKEFFRNQMENWRQFGDGMDRAKPNVEYAKDGKSAISFTNFDARITIETGAQAFTLFKAIGFDNLPAAGFDGLMMKREGGAAWVVMHRPEGNVKSAVGNNGEYDPAIADIRFSRQRKAEAFDRWFEGSQAVGEDGKPLVVYHSTTSREQIDVFNRRHKPDVMGGKDGLDSIGTWFTNNPARIDDYGVAAYPAYVSIKNPLVLDSFAQLRDLWTDSQTQGKRNKAYYARKKLFDQNNHWGDSDEFVNELEIDGYDGIIIKQHGDGEWADQAAYIVFNPTQIKSAIGNNGDFDPANPDIRFQRVANASPQQFTSFVELDAERDAMRKGIESIRFHHWFGESKVARWDGTPNVVYHGTRHFAGDIGDIQSFDRKFTEKRFGRKQNIDMIGSWFSDTHDDQGAEKYSGMIDGSVIYPVYLSIKNPKVYDTFNDLLADWKAVQQSDAVSAEDRERNQRHQMHGNADAFVAHLKALGFDGMYLHMHQDVATGMTEFGWQNVWVAFDAEQVRFAIPLGAPEARYQRVWHGSPHEFNEFSKTAIGNGEGNQAYGWGLYFASQKEVADIYRNTLSYPLFDGRRVDAALQDELNKTDGDITAYAVSFVGIFGSVKTAKTELEKEIIAYGNTLSKDALEWLEANKNRFALGGQLYEVNIPEDNKFLRWDLPLYQQSQAVKEAFGALCANGLSDEEMVAKIKLGLQFDRFTELTGEAVYRMLANNVYATEKTTSLALHDYGIEGIAYPDGLTRGTDNVTLNYVLFTETKVVIENKHIQTNKKEETPALQRWLSATKVVDEVGKPKVVFHGTNQAVGEFDPSKTVDGGLHFGTADQANMRASGQGKNLIPVYLNIKNPRRRKDAGGKWKSKIESAKADGHDGIVYLNRYEGITTERINQLARDGVLDKLDAMSDANFRKHVPEAQDSYIAFESSQVRSIFDLPQQGLENERSQHGEQIEFRDELTAAYSGQQNMTLSAYRGKQLLGRLDYVIYGDEVSISMISVPEEHRRRGYGAALVQHLQAQFPEAEIKWGMMTDDDAALYDSLPKVEIEVPDVAAKMQELAEKTAECDRLRELADAFHAKPDSTEEERLQVLQQLATMNDLHGAVDVLESELYGKRARKTLIAVPSSESKEEPLQEAVDRLRRTWAARGVDSWIGCGKDGCLTLSRLVVPKDMRKSGLGTKFMSELIALADARGARIALTPSTDFGATSVARLKAFYKRFGFVENKGRYKDFSLSETMYRKCQQPRLETAQFLRAPDAQVLAGLRLTSELSAVKALADVFGSKVMLFRQSKDSELKFNGVHYDDAIWLNENSQKPLHVVFGHELIHMMRAERPDLYAGLYAALKPLLLDEKMYVKLVGLQGSTPAMVHEEMIADLLGDRFAERSFWKLVASHNPGIFKGIASYVTSVIDRIKLAFAGDRFDQTLMSEKFVSDLDAARQVLAQAVAEYGADKQLGTQRHGFFESIKSAAGRWISDQPLAFDMRRVSTLLAEDIDDELKAIFGDATGREASYENVFEWVLGPALGKDTVREVQERLLAVAERRGYISPAARKTIAVSVEGQQDSRQSDFAVASVQEPAHSKSDDAELGPA